jgi:redox-sensitive bicupin YhaK (pirin superfamily)
MIQIRRGSERGRTELGWLDSRHTFSFGDYHDPKHMGFRALRVLNDDRVRPGQGFGTHPHRDMEIVTFVIAGALEHKDSLGTGSVIRPGDVQRMSAGTGVLHSEFNPSPTEATHFLQIWILPEEHGLPPGYEQRTFSEAERRGRLRLVAARDGRDGAVTIHQDAEIRIALLAPGERAAHPLRPGRHAWVQVATGEVRLGSATLGEGDGAAMTGEAAAEIEGVSAAEVLVFDLA